MVGRYFDGVLPAPRSTSRPSWRRRRAGDRGRDADAAIDRLDLAGRDRRGRGRSSTRSTATSPSRSRGSSRRTTRPRGRLDTVLYTTAEGLRALAVLLNPVMPKATRDALGSRSAPRPTLGPLAEQPSQRRRRAGVSCPPGATVTKARAAVPAHRGARARREPPVTAPTRRARRPGRATARATRRRPSRCGCRSPTATATSTSPTPPDDWLDGRATRSPRRPPSACRGSCRSAATCPRRGGRSRRRARTTQLVAGVALHPNEAPRAAPRAGALDAALAEIDALAADPRVRAVGETGLDYFRTGADGRAGAGGVVPRAHRDGEAARQGAGHPRPRRARRRAARARGRGRAGPRSSSTASPATPRWRGTAPTRGCVPVVRRHRDVQERRRRCATRCAVAPLDRLLVETDAPFLTPMPYRGRPNASYLIPHTVRAMAAGARASTRTTLASAIAASTEAAFGSW